jgi:hypothetical protein
VADNDGGQGDGPRLLYRQGSRISQHDPTGEITLTLTLDGSAEVTRTTGDNVTRR